MDQGRLSWTQEEEDVLTSLLEKGVLVETIAKVLGRSKASVRSKISHMGLTLPERHATIDYELYRRLMEPEDI